MAYLSIVDLFLTPVYLIIIYLLAARIRNRYYPPGHQLHGYFLTGLTVKIVGALTICLIYIFYFQTGDTLTYYESVKIINGSFNDSPLTWLKLITHSADPDNVNEGYFISQLYYYNNMPSYIVCIVGAVIGKLCFSRLLCIAIIIASIAYTGIWVLFVTFTKLYPRLVKQSAVAVLLLPDTALWGSALFKDTICMFALGWLIYAFFRMTSSKKTFSSTLIIILASSLIFSIKPYIMFTLLPALLVRVITGILASKIALSQKLIGIGTIALIAVISFSTLKNNVEGDLTKVALENLTDIVTSFSSNTLEISEQDNGSGYNLGDIDGSVSGFVSKIIPAINVTFFRPYLWEVNKVMTWLSALESATLFAFFVYVILKARLLVFKYLAIDQNLLTFLLFGCVFGYIVGITTYNFGTLSRFKIPCMPFFLFSLFIIDNYRRREKITKKEI